MTKSKTTKKYSRLALIFTLLSLFCMLGPAAYYIVMGLTTSTVLIQKVTLVAAVAVSLILTVLCAVNRWAFRSKIWLIILALFFVVDHYLVMIIIFGATQILDELIFSPLAKYFRNKKSINVEIDKRMGV